MDLTKSIEAYHGWKLSFKRMWGQPIFRQGPRLSFWILELGECNAIYLYLFPLLTTLFCIWANYQLDEKFEPIINSMSICSEHRRLQLPHSRERRTGGELVHRKWTFEASAVYHQQLVQRCNRVRQCAAAVQTLVELVQEVAGARSTCPAFTVL